MQSRDKRGNGFCLSTDGKIDTWQGTGDCCRLDTISVTMVVIGIVVLSLCMGGIVYYLACRSRVQTVDGVPLASPIFSPVGKDNEGPRSTPPEHYGSMYDKMKEVQVEAPSSEENA